MKDGLKMKTPGFIIRSTGEPGQVVIEKATSTPQPSNGRD